MTIFLSYSNMFIPLGCSSFPHEVIPFARSVPSSVIGASPFSEAVKDAAGVDEFRVVDLPVQTPLWLSWLSWLSWLVH